mmetsp:Transcript_22120/g.48103  ORF Transcript_22120/g.48103 Transcript_22120/m.48103 type:complete len:212 (-) Transcript_22120:345-980(-)
MPINTIMVLVEALIALIRGVQSRSREQKQTASGFNSSAPDTTMRVAVRPHNDVKKLFITFAISFLAIHQLIHSFITPSSKMGADAKTCVETKENNFLCTNDPKEARKKARKTTQYYLQNFGIPQTIEGSGDENKRMKGVANSMENYLKHWIMAYEHVESLKERCTNKHDKCVFWASIGECMKNPGYMESDCILACQVCSKLLETPESKTEL